MQELADHRFAGLMEAAPDAMICVEPDGRIALVNAQTERMFGYRRAELIGQPVEILIPDGARDRHAGLRAGYARHPRRRPMDIGLELAGRRRDGSIFPAEISLSSVGDGPDMLLTAAVRDVTERRRAEAEREQLRAQAERARLAHQHEQAQRLESLGQLAGGVAHDFNNLLNVISSYAAFIAEDSENEATPARWQAIRADIGQIQKAAERAVGLTHQLLSFARREVIQPRVLNFNNLVADVKKLLQRTLGEHIELATDLAGDLAAVTADPGQIEQILVNLAVNARDAMPGGGTLTIETANTPVDEAYAAFRDNLSPGDYVALTVSDTGTGMPPEVIARACEPFYTTKPQGEGTGLGLATVYGIITQAGGDIRIYSEPGHGTTITLLLPATATARQRTAAEPPPAQRQPRSGAGQTILIAEDENALREVTRRVLARNGYQVLTAASGQEALDTAAAHPGPIDILLTNVVMPKMQGKEVADRIRELQPRIRVLFMSGYTQGILGAQGILEPGINLIQKPFTEAILLEKINAIPAPP